MGTVEYQRQPSKETARDPRNPRDLPRAQRHFRRPFLSVNNNWIGREPPRTLLIGAIPNRQVKSEAGCLALLEEQCRRDDLEIERIELACDKDGSFAAVHFSTGFKAWECARVLVASDWMVEADRDAVLFLARQAQMKPLPADSRATDSQSRHRPRSPSPAKHRAQPARPKLSCSLFVPCLTIPFSCEDRLDFRLTQSLLLSLFPATRFPSISTIEEGSSSWHIHFGREIDVVEADRMLLHDDFVWKGRSFFIDKWRLVKDGHAWRIPDSYKDRSETKRGMEKQTVSVAASLYSHDPEDFSHVTKSLPRFARRREDESTVTGMEMDAHATTEERQDSQSPIPSPPPAPTPAEAPARTRRESVKKKAPLHEASLLPVPEQPGVSTPSDSGADSVEVMAEFSSELTPSRSISSGSVRTEGFFQLSHAEKQRICLPGTLEAFSVGSSVGSSAGSEREPTQSSLSGRSSRAQNRRPLAAIASASTLDLFKVSPLQSTQKRVVLRNSSIHSHGLVLMEPAETGDLIIEYVGELIRASVANLRELRYEREHRGDGIASSYLFRLDDVMVLDASSMGNLARFINHSCEPNCVAKTITLNGSKRIVMYAKRAIRVGEEITYDYKFPTEKNPLKKVKCLCGSANCRKTLN